MSNVMAFPGYRLSAEEHHEIAVLGWVEHHTAAQQQVIAAAAAFKAVLLAVDVKPEHWPFHGYDLTETIETIDCFIANAHTSDELTRMADQDLEDVE